MWAITKKILQLRTESNGLQQIIFLSYKNLNFTDMSAQTLNKNIAFQGQTTDINFRQRARIIITRLIPN